MLLSKMHGKLFQPSLALMRALQRVVLGTPFYGEKRYFLEYEKNTWVEEEGVALESCHVKQEFDTCVWLLAIKINSVYIFMG